LKDGWPVTAGGVRAAPGGCVTPDASSEVRIHASDCNAGANDVQMGPRPV